MPLIVSLLFIVILFANSLQGESKAFPPPCVMGDESIMRQKAHGKKEKQAIKMNEWNQSFMN